jgi:hypothetical protein
MTSLQKSLVAAALAVVAAAGMYEAALFARQRPDLDALEQQVTALTLGLAQARKQQAAAAQKLTAVESDIDAQLARLAARVSSNDAALETQIRAWLADLDFLRRQLDSQPNLRIPELALLTTGDWLEGARLIANVKSEANTRSVLALLRGQAESKMAHKIKTALTGYLKQSDNRLPDQVEQLLPFFDPPIDPAWLGRYEMWQTGKAHAARNALGVVGIKAPANLESDQIWIIGVEPIWRMSAMGFNLNEAQRAYALAHPGPPTKVTAAQLIPFLRWPASESVLQEHLEPQVGIRSHSP